MLVRALSSCGGFVAALLYLCALSRCQTCVGCTLWLINVMAFLHAGVALYCMVTDSAAVAQVQSFCTAGIQISDGGKAKVGVCKGRGGSEKPTCVLFQYVLVCLWDAGLGLLWLFAGYAMCKSRSVRNSE